MKVYDFKVILEPDEESGYVVTCPSLSGCYSQGETIDEALSNIREAIELYLEPAEDDYLPSKDKAEILELAL